MKNKKIVAFLLSFLACICVGIFCVSCGKPTVKEISINADSVQTEILYGTEFNYDDIKVTAKLSDGTEQVLSHEECEFSKIDTTVLGKQTLTVTYGLYEAKIEITVYEKLERISVQYVNPADATTGYVLQGETLDLSKFKVVAFYSKNQVTLKNSEVTFSSVDTSTLGEKTLEVSYNGKSTSVKVHVIESWADVIGLEIESISIVPSSVATSVYQNETYNVSNLQIVVTYKNGLTATLNYSDHLEGEDKISVSTIDTTKVGKQNLVATFKDFSSPAIEVEVKKTYTVMGFSDPAFVTLYNANKANANEFNKTGSTGKKGFSVTNNEYLVGDDNAFIFSPIMQVRTKDGEYKNFAEYKAIISVYLCTNEVTGTYELLEGENLASYVEFDEIKHTFKFTEKGLTKRFKITILPYGLTSSEAAEIEAKSFEFRVVDGWNAYSAKDISLIDNANVNNKWSELKSAEEIEISKNIRRIILHTNITISDSDIPSVHFLTNPSDIPAEAGSEDYNRAFGSLIDSTKDGIGYIYQRNLKNGEEFTIEGNYFTLSAQNLSLIVTQEVDGVLKIFKKDEALTVHTTLFAFCGDRSNPEGESANCNLNNISLYGNTKKSEDATLSGGVMFVKSWGLNFTAYNNLSQCWFISYMFEGASEYDDKMVNTLNHVNAFDAYNTFLYVWGTRDLRIQNSTFIGAGGPVMICDHVSNNQTTGEGGYITNVKTTNSILESYVAGTEGWFNTYSGSGAIVQGIKAMNALVTPYGNTLCDKSGQKINLIAVYKSSSAEGLTQSKIRGSFADTDEKYTNGLDLSNAGVEATKNQIIAQLAASGMSPEQIAKTLEQMAILQTFNGAVGVPGTDGWLSAPDSATFAAAEGYMNIYLFNGMAAVLGLEKAA